MLEDGALERALLRDSAGPPLAVGLVQYRSSLYG